VTTTAGQLGNSFVVTVKLMFVREARVQRWTETVPAKEDMLADADDGTRQTATRADPSSPSRRHRIQLQPLQT